MFCRRLCYRFWLNTKKIVKLKQERRDVIKSTINLSYALLFNVIIHSLGKKTQLAST